MDIKQNEYPNTDKVTWLQFLRQVNTCLTIWCFYFIVGLMTGSPTVAIAQMIKETNAETIKGDKMYPWITSISSYTGIGFCVILTLISHYCGRKKTVFVISIASFVGSALFYFSHSPTLMFFSQMIFGVTGAGQVTVYAMILTEHTSTKYRGIFLTLKSATFFWGIWTANAIGIFTHYKYIALVALMCSSYCFVNGFFIPESPYWLAFRGKYDECADSHRWLKGKSANAEKELESLIKLQQELRQKEQMKDIRKIISNYLIFIQQAEFYKPLCLCSLVFLIYHISGKLVSAIYAVEIMQEITNNESTAHIGILILDGFSVLGMYVGCGISKVLKRRTMLLVTSTIGTTFLFIMALYLYLVKLSVISENAYIIITLLVVYSLAICCGPAIMSTSIFGELLPIQFRSFSICCSGAVVILLFATIVKTSPLMFDAFDIHGTFFFYGICSTICIILTYKFLPETKDKSIYEIAALFKNTKP